MLLLRDVLLSTDPLSNQSSESPVRCLQSCGRGRGRGRGMHSERDFEISKNACSFWLSFSFISSRQHNQVPYLKESTSVQQPSSIMSSQQQQQHKQPKPSPQPSLPPLPVASTDKNERTTSIDSQVYFEGGDDYDDYDDFSPSTSGGGGAQTKRQDQRDGSGGAGGTIYSAKHVRQKEAQQQQQQKPSGK